jgi:uncharacterized membrane protein YgaE (UPF0421/DUF939 family)
MLLNNILTALAVKINPVDIVFLIIIAVVVAGIVTFYFLQPIIRKKEIEEQRANFKKREATFRENLKQLQGDKE